MITVPDHAGHFNLIDFHFTALALNRFAFPGQLIEALPVHLDSGIHRWNLRNHTLKRFQHCKYFGFRNMHLINGFRNRTC
ncbi:hypothetical protein D3C75_1253480 [compost metagenome]